MYLDASKASVIGVTVSQTTVSFEAYGARVRNFESAEIIFSVCSSGFLFIIINNSSETSIYSTKNYPNFNTFL